MDANRRSIKLIAAVAGIVVLLAAPAPAQDTGVLLVTETEQIPLKTYAEFMNAGILRITSGAIRDIPTIDTFRLIRCSITGWHPVAVLVASEELFKSEYAERRQIPIALRPVGVTAVAVRVADLEQPSRIAELHRAIGRPEGGEEAYFFLVLTSGGITRYYPFRMRQAAQ
jgi:hypothetical protein